jgi:hypothetical protein
MRRAFVLLLLLSSPAWAEGTAVPTEYPQADRKLFMQGCVNNDNAMQDICSCILTRFQNTMTFEQFVAMNQLTDAQLRKHAPYASAIIDCANAHY